MAEKYQPLSFFQKSLGYKGKFQKSDSFLEHIKAITYGCLRSTCDMTVSSRKSLEDAWQ